MRRRDSYSARTVAILIVLALSAGWPSDAAAYAVLAHEAIIDSAWDASMRPLLLKRFPDATPEQLQASAKAFEAPGIASAFAQHMAERHARQGIGGKLYVYRFLK